MDDDFDSLNIFDVAESWIDFSQNIRPTRAPVSLEDAGVLCELKEYDSVYDADGTRVKVSSGSFIRLKDRSSDSFKSALVKTRYWSREGEEEKCDLEIRPSHMKEALKTIVPSYKAANYDTKHITLPNAGRDLFHYLQDLFVYGQLLPADSEDQKHVSFLIQYIYDEFSQALSVHNAFVGLNLGPPSLDFNRLWMVFKPGEPVYVPASMPKYPVPFAFEFESMTLSCRCREWAVFAVTSGGCTTLSSIRTANLRDPSATL